MQFSGDYYELLMNDSLIIKIFISSSCLTKSCLDNYNIISFLDNHFFQLLHLSFYHIFHIANKIAIKIGIKIGIKIAIKISIKIAIKIPIIIPLRFP